MLASWHGLSAHSAISGNWQVENSAKSTVFSKGLITPKHGVEHHESEANYTELGNSKRLDYQVNNTLTTTLK